MKSSIIDSIKALPPLSSTIIEINKIYANENSTINDMAKAIEKDPMIIANLLKAANSPLYGFGREIKNAAQAVSLFGMGMTRSIAIGNSIRKLLNVDMQPYGITPENFAHISSLQAGLMIKWYQKIDRIKADRLYLAAFLQETGKILIASSIIQDDEITSFSNEIANSNELSAVEKTYVDVTSGEVTALVFEHWKFASDFNDMIRYSDNPDSAPSDIREYSTALNIVKTILPINAPLSDVAVNFGLKKAKDAGYDISILQAAIDNIRESL